MAKAELSLHAEYRWKGQWWPVGINDKLVGELRFEPYEWISVDVVGVWGQLAFESITGQPNLLGMTTTGKPVTLRHPVAGIASLSVPGMATSNAKTNLAFVGGHYDDEPTYVLVKASYSGLEEWLGITGVAIQRGKAGEPHATITLSDAPKVEVRVEAIKATIELGVDGWLDPNRFDAKVRADAFIRIKPDAPKPWSWYWTQLVHIQYFLALMTDQESVPSWLRGARSQEEVHPGRFKTEYDEVLTTYEKHLPPKPFPSNFMIASRDHLGEQLAPMLSKWLGHYDTVAPLCDLLFAYRYADRMYVQFQLLALTQGLEGFHRLVHGGTYLSKEEWEPHRQTLAQAIPSTLDDGHKHSLRNRVRWGFEYSLRKRLTHLISGLSLTEQAYVSGNPNAFVGAIVDARNAATHYGSEAESIDWHIVAGWVNRLDALSICLLLRWMGMSEDQVVAAIKRPNRFKPVTTGVT